MELFTKLFGSWLVFVYHCFDRMVLSGYLMGLQRPGQVVYWLQNVLGIEAITKEVLSSRTQDYVRWVEAFVRKQRLPLEWAGCRLSYSASAPCPLPLLLFLFARPSAGADDRSHGNFHSV